MTTDWKLEGSYFEACDCEAACPCNMQGAPTDGECTVLVGWHIDKGAFTATTLDGLNVAMVVHSPGHMLQSKWKVALYLDSRASESQCDALTQIFSGQVGGLIGQLSGFIGEIAGVRNVPIDYWREGRVRGISIGDIASAEIEAISGGDGAEVTIHNPPVNLSPGHDLVVARSRQCSFEDYGMTLAVSNKNGYYAPFTYNPG